jgi:electron transfer flavoprotein beta subunit
MQVVVLTKSVPNTTGDERFGPGFRLDRGAIDPIINPNDEYAIEVALRLAEAGPGVEITMLTMGPEAAWPGLTKGLAVGVHKAVLVADPGLEGSCALVTANTLAAALRRIEFDLILAGVDTSDGRAGVVGSAVATLLGIPFITHAGTLAVRDGVVEVRRLRDDGHERLEVPLPAFVSVTQEVGDLRYPSLRGIMASRSKKPTTWTLGDLGVDAADAGGARATTVVLDVEPPDPRPPARVVSGEPGAVVGEIVEFIAERGVVS